MNKEHENEHALDIHYTDIFDYFSISQLITKIDIELRNARCSEGWRPAQDIRVRFEIEVAPRDKDREQFTNWMQLYKDVLHSVWKSLRSASTDFSEIIFRKVPTEKNVSTACMHIRWKDNE